MSKKSKAKARKAAQQEKKHLKNQNRQAKQEKKAELEREVWRFSALDSLFFRESRPMDTVGDAELLSVFPPPARTMMGALRSIIGEYWDGGVDWAAYRQGDVPELSALIGDDDDFKTLRFNGPWVREKGRRLYPAPANLMGKWEKGPLSALAFLQVGEPCRCDLGRAVRLPSLPDKYRGYKSLGGSWLDADAFAAVLEGKTPDPAHVLGNEALFAAETRVGLALTSKRTAHDGLLYQTRHLRLSDDVSIELDVAGIDARQRPERALTRLGGEGRMAVMKVDTEPAALLSAPQVKAQIHGLVLYVLTPFYIAPGEVLPGFRLVEDAPETVWQGEIAGVSLTLHCAALGKALREGGWDLRNKGPRTVRSLVPAGSAFYCTTAHPAEAIEKLHYAYAAEDENEKALGRGLLAVGLWHKNRQEKTSL